MMPTFLTTVLPGVLVLCLIILPAGAASARAGGSLEYQKTERTDSLAVIRDVEEGLIAGKASLFSHHFASQVHLGLRHAEAGAFSAGQAYYIIESYLKSRHILSVRLGAISGSGDHVAVRGEAMVVVGGTQEPAQVYVALIRSGGRWVITRINVN